MAHKSKLLVIPSSDADGPMFTGLCDQCGEFFLHIKAGCQRCGDCGVGWCSRRCKNRSTHFLSCVPTTTIKDWYICWEIRYAVWNLYNIHFHNLFTFTDK